MPSIYNLVPGAVGAPPVNIFSGTVSTKFPAPFSRSEPLYVDVDWSPNVPLVINGWGSGGAGMPQQGDDVLIIQDDRRNQRVVWWSGAEVTTETAARAWLAGAATTTAGAATKIPLDTLSFDLGFHFDVTTNHRYNVPATGLYQVNAQVSAVTLGTSMRAYLSGAYDTINGNYVVPFNVTSWDPGNNYVASASTYVAPAAGLYQVSAASVIYIGSPGVTTGIRTQINVNGSYVAQRGATVSDIYGYSWSEVYDVAFLEKGDRVQTVVAAESAWAFNTAVMSIGRVNDEGYVAIYKNGTEWSRGSATTVGDLVQCVAGDYLELWTYTGQAVALASPGAGGNDVAGGNQNYMSVSRILS